MLFHRFQGAVSIFFLCLCLSACGGGENSSTVAGSGDVVSVSLETACSGDNGDSCGAAGATSYAGQGIGVWSYSNTSQSEQLVSVSLSGLGSKPVTLIYTNTGDSYQPMPSLTLTPLYTQRSQSQQELPEARPSAAVNRIPALVRNFKPLLPALTTEGARKQVLGDTSVTPQAIGSERSWYVSVDDNLIQSRQATLRRQATVGDRTINLWLENTEYGADKVSDAMLDTLLEKVASGSNAVYTQVSDLIGQPWGEHAYTSLIAPSQPLDVVFVNFVPDGAAYGLLGYFWSANNFKKDAQNDFLKYSNESLSVFIDTETLYLVGSLGMTDQVSTLAHELVHAVNFYQRNVRQGSSYAFETFLEEMSAVMIEDILAQRITPGSNSVKDSRIAGWFANPGFNCDFAFWINDAGAQCFGYNQAGSLGAYLVRQHGVGFYQKLLQNTSSSNSLDVLTNAIAQAGGPSLATTLERWAANAALLPPQAPAGFGWPARTDQGINLEAIDGQIYASLRNLPLTVPSSLAPHGGSFPFQRSPNWQGVYEEQFSLPPGVALTAVVQ